MGHPWFHDVNLFDTWYGAFFGVVFGTLGGLLGGLAGFWVPQGKGRRFILGAMTTFAIFGTLLFITGIVALATGQPWGIWYPFAMSGLASGGVMGGLLPHARRLYAQAEARKLEAGALRHS